MRAGLPCGPTRIAAPPIPLHSELGCTTEQQRVVYPEVGWPEIVTCCVTYCVQIMGNMGSMGDGGRMPYLPVNTQVLESQIVGVWGLKALITRRSQVRILSPLFATIPTLAVLGEGCFVLAGAGREAGCGRVEVPWW